jgi:hypothetical protein
MALHFSGKNFQEFAKKRFFRPARIMRGEADPPPRTAPEKA